MLNFACAIRAPIAALARSSPSRLRSFSRAHCPLTICLCIPVWQLQPCFGWPNTSSRSISNWVLPIASAREALFLVFQATSAVVSGTLLPPICCPSAVPRPSPSRANAANYCCSTQDWCVVLVHGIFSLAFSALVQSTWCPSTRLLWCNSARLIWSSFPASQPTQLTRSISLNTMEYSANPMPLALLDALLQL